MPRRRGLRPRLLAAMVRSNATLAFAAERQVVGRTGNARMRKEPRSQQENAAGCPARNRQDRHGNRSPCPVHVLWSR